MSRKRQSITFSGEAAELVERLANERDTTASEVVRHALALEKWFEDTKRAHEEIYVKPEGQDMVRVHIV